MSRGNEHAGTKDIRQHNVTVFQNFKKKLVEENLKNDPVKWVKVAHTLLVFVCDARIYYDEARPDTVDCVEIATGAVMSRVPGELQQIRPITASHLPEPYRTAFDELRRLLVVVGSYQPEMLNPSKGGESRHDLLSRIRNCIAAFGLNPDSLLDKPSLEAAMQSVGLDDQSRQTVLKSLAKRRPDAVSSISSARSTPSMATPVLSAASPHTTASPQVMVPVTPTTYSGPSPIPMHPTAPHVPSQMLAQPTVSPVITQHLPSPTTPTTVASPVRVNGDAPKPRKQPKWMARDLDIFRKEKMANAGAATVPPVNQQPVSPAVPHPGVMPQIQPPTAPPMPASNQPPIANVPAKVSSPEVTSASQYRTVEAHARPSGADASYFRAKDTPSQVTGVDSRLSEAMDVDTPLLDEPAPPEDRPLPYTLPPGPYPYTSTPSWSDLFAEAIRAAHEHKLSIGDMIRYVTTVYAIKGTKNAAGAMFNSKAARQSGKANVLSGTITDDIHIPKQPKVIQGPRFVRTADVYPVTWTLEDLEPPAAAEPVLSEAAPAETEVEAVVIEALAPTPDEQNSSAAPVEAPTIAASKDPGVSANDVSQESTQGISMPNATPALPYKLRPGPYSPAKPTKALAILIQEAILAGTLDKALSQSDVLSYIRTVYPFYASYPHLEDEVSGFLQQHFAPKDDGRWSLWIRDGSEEERPVPFTLPPGPHSSAKPDKPLLDLMREAISASNEGSLTQRDVAAYVLSVAPYYNGADEPLPFGQLMKEHFTQRGSDAEGRPLWGVKEDVPAVDDQHAVAAEEREQVVQEDDATSTASPVTPMLTQSESRPSSRPPKFKGPPKSAAVVDSNDEQPSDLETPDPITPSTASAAAAIPSSVTEIPPPSAISPASRPFVLPPGPYSSHKPLKTREEVVIEALRASATGQLKKKDIVLYIQTVYPWFRRDERAILGCKKMVDNIMSRLRGTWVTRIGLGLYKLNDPPLSPAATSLAARGVLEDEDMDDVQPPAPKSTQPTSISPVLTIRIPPRQASGDHSVSTAPKRSAPSASPARSESPSLPKRIKLTFRGDKSIAAPSPHSMHNDDVAPKTKSPSLVSQTRDEPTPKTNGVHSPEHSALEDEVVASPSGKQANVEMQDDPEVLKGPDPPPLPPVSFGQDACLVDVAFGRPITASFALHIHPQMEQWNMLERWRNSASNNDDVSEALCYSLACYRSEDVYSLKDEIAADAWGDTLVRTEIPVSLHNQALHSLCLMGNGRTVPFPLTWMTATASPLFLDISAYLVPGDNELTLAHAVDLSAYTFVIVAHRPNAHQLRWLNARREPWRRLQAQINDTIQVPPLDYDALLLSSKDISHVDIDRGVPQELLTLS